MDQELKMYLEGLEKRLSRKIEDARTELLARLESSAAGEDIRLRKLEEYQATSEHSSVKRRCP